MKRVLFAVVGLFFSLQATAQVGAALTINLERVGTEAPCTGDEVCINVTAEDFTDIVALQSFFTWNPSVLAYKSFVPGSLTNLSAANFNLSSQADGSIFLDWNGIPCGSSSGLTIADGEVLFQLCYTARGSYGAATTITMPVTDFPNAVNYPRALKNNTCSANINVGVSTTSEIISTCVNPVEISASAEQAQEGDLVCVDYTVNGFENIASAQFSINWDAAALAFENLIIPTSVQNQIGLQSSDFGLPSQPNVGPGNLTLSWFLLSGDPNYVGKSLEDGTVMFQVCYRVNGACETSSTITFSDNPTIAEFSNFRTDTLAADGSRVNFVFPQGTYAFVPGGVTVGECEPDGLKIAVSCGDPVNIGDVICVPVTSDNFNNIFEMRYFLDWNEEILRFKEVKSFATALQLRNSNFDAGNAANGILGVNWKSSALPVTLPAGTTLYEVCFDVIGFGGNSPISVKGSPMVARQTNNGVNIGVAPKNCTVEVNDPGEVGISITSGSARTGETVCLDVSVNNFSRMLEFGFPLNWDAGEIGFKSIENLNFPGATITDNFDLSQAESGYLYFDWSNATGLSLPPDEVIFQVCFEILGGPAEECIDVLILDQLFPAIAISETSGGNDLGILKQEGQACILFPNGFYMEVGQAEGYLLDTICVPFEVSYFDLISRANFSVEWDPSALFFVGAEGNPVLEENSIFTFNDNSALVGLLGVDWESTVGPWSFGVDSVLFFEACFVALGPARDCYDISISSTPAPEVITIDGSGSLISDPGQVCIRDTIFILEELVQPVSCSDAEDGAIQLVISGGQDPVGILWKTSPEQFGPSAKNLPAGDVEVIIFDNARPSVMVSRTINIPVAGPTVAANAGADKVLPCNDPGVILNGSGPGGTDYSFSWATTFNPSNVLATSSNYVATSPGTYVLTVTHKEFGCQARDTVVVTPDLLPTANAGSDRAITCEVSTATLRADNSQNDVSYLWSSPDGGMITPGQENLYNPMVTAIGTYVLQVTRNDNGCFATDTVRVNDRTAPPVMNAPDVNLACGGEPRTLFAEFEIPGPPAEFVWTTLNGDTISRSNTVTVSEPGQYIVTGLDEFTGCSTTDTVTVEPGNDFPEINAGPDLEFSCAVDSLVVLAQTDAVNYQVLWTSLENGGAIISERENLRAVFGAPGVYQVTINDLDRFCSATDTVVVQDIRVLPQIVLTDSIPLNCTTQSIVLDATGSSSGAGFTNTWTKDGVIIGENTYNIGVNEPGLYVFELTNTAIGCTARKVVEVVKDANTPTVSIAEPAFQIGCAFDTIALVASVLEELPNFSVEWRTINNSGRIVTPVNQLSVSVDKGGLYQVLVRNTDNDCVGTATFEVIEDFTAPVADAGVDKFIGCNSDTVLIGGASSQGNFFRYAWAAIQDGGEARPPFDDSTLVTLPGIYELTVTDTRNGCTATDQVQVSANVAIPKVVIKDPDVLTCTNDIITLDGTGSDFGSGFTAEWRGLDFNDLTIKETGNPLVINVVEEGFYELTVTNGATGCFTKDTVFVDANQTLPVIIFDEAPVISCQQQVGVISAKQSFLPSQFTPIWTSVDPVLTITPTDTNDLVATVSGPGQYVLELMLSGNGCSAKDTITVSADAETPVANAGSAAMITCGGTLTLDGTASSSGENFVYRWSVVEGTGTIENDTSLMPTIDAAGTYALIVTNPMNACSDTATVTVTVSTTNLPLANAGQDVQVCEDGATLSADLPDGSTGAWRVSGGTAMLDSPLDPVTFADNLSAGSNVFVWSLSRPGCENYSSDSVVVTLLATPQAQDDRYTLPFGSSTLNINLPANDNVSGVGAFTIELLSSPTQGDLSGFVNGVGVYTLKGKPGLEVVDTFSYRICSVLCPDSCSEAQVEITIEADDTPPVSRDSMPNGITPNGDGLNDAFVFDVLLNNPNDFPDNEMIIFNRWGDIVFEAKPYLNNWQGTNTAGEELPTGTYYYILRLDLANGKIIRGDVTIVR